MKLPDRFYIVMSNYNGEWGSFDPETDKDAVYDLFVDNAEERATRVLCIDSNDAGNPQSISDVTDEFVTMMEDICDERGLTMELVV